MTAGWTELPDGAGTVLAGAGEWTVATQSGRLRAWREATPTVTVEVPAANAGRPTIVGARALWGAFSIDLVDGTFEHIPAAAPDDGYLQTAHAWSRDGAVAVCAASLLEPDGRTPSAVWLSDGQSRTSLWSGHDVAPKALCATESAVIVGHRSPDVYTHDATLLRTLDGVTSPLRLDARAGRLLVVESSTLTVWDLGPGARVAQASGAWIDACLTPDGRSLLAVDSAGRLRLHEVTDALPAVRDVAADAPVVAVSATDGHIVAGFNAVPVIRRCPLSGVE
jgi:hypothetical protein